MRSNNYLHNKDLTRTARTLRKNATPQENKLWHQFLCYYEVKFYRQKVFGNYIVDFYCSKAKLVIEVDGSQHLEEEAIAYDNNRTAYLNSLGIEVIRFGNDEIDDDLDSVCRYIDEIVQSKL